MTVYIDAVITSPEEHDYGIPKFGKVSFVDLAGSERLKDTKSAGEMLKETSSINKSLFTLGKVVAAVGNPPPPPAPTHPLPAVSLPTCPCYCQHILGHGIKINHAVLQVQ